MNNVTPLSIRDLNDSKDFDVWVLNNFSGDARGDIYIDVAKQSGQGTDLIMIPNTFVPVNLSDQVSKKQLIKSSDFRRAINSRYVLLISDKDAADKLAEDGAQEEADRVRGLISGKNEAGAAAINSMVGKVVTDENGMTSVDTEIEEDKVSKPVRMLIEGVDDKTEDTSLINTLRRMDVTQDDWKYIRAEAKKIKRRPLYDFAKKNLTRP